MSRINKEETTPYFEKWDSVALEIENLYKEKDKKAIELMLTAIENYEELLEYGGKEIDKQTGKSVYVLFPLNGEERIEFIKARIQSHYAHVQLNMLYLEMKKKVARICAMNDRKSKSE